MPAPSKSFTVIPDSSIDPDSPVTTELMTEFRDNDIHLEEWLGKNYAAAVDHDHDGANSKLISAGALTASVFDMDSTGTMSTGALGFTPVAAFIVGIAHYLIPLTGYTDNIFSGFATGTGSLSKGMAHCIADSIGVLGGAFAIDADAVGGQPLGSYASSFSADLDITAWGSANITFSWGGNGDVKFKVLVLGTL